MDRTAAMAERISRTHPNPNPNPNQVSQQLELLRPAVAPGYDIDHAGGVSEVMRRFDDKMNSLDPSLLRRAGDGTKWGQAAGAAGEAVRNSRGRRRKTAATGVSGVAAAALAAAAAARPVGPGGVTLADCARGAF